MPRPSVVEEVAGQVPDSLNLKNLSSSNETAAANLGPVLGPVSDSSAQNETATSNGTQSPSNEASTEPRTDFNEWQEYDLQVEANFNWLLDMLLPGILGFLFNQTVIRFLKALYAQWTAKKEESTSPTDAEASEKLDQIAESTLIYSTILPPHVNNQLIIDQLSGSAQARSKWQSHGAKVTRSTAAQAKSREHY